MSTKPYMDLLRLSEEQVLEIVRELQRKDSSSRKDNQRQHERLPFHEDALLLCEIKTARGGPPFLVKCIDVSAGGLGFLHGAYIHVDTPCVVTLVVRKKTGFRVEAKVARCQHHRGHIHIVGVKFDQAMDPKQVDALKAEMI